MMLADRFQHATRRAVELANQQAWSLNHNYLGTEHLLLGLTIGQFGLASRVLVESGITEATLKKQVVNELGGCPPAITGSDADALRSLGIDLDLVGKRAEEAFGPSALAGSPDAPLTPKARRALRRSLQQARMLGHHHVAPEHLLLALLRDPKALAVKLISRRGVSPDFLRDRVLTGLREAS